MKCRARPSRAPARVVSSEIGSAAPGPNAHLGGLVGHRSRVACTKFLQLLPAEEEDMLLRQEVSTSKGGNGTQCPLWARSRGGWKSALHDSSQGGLHVA